uniref:Uncharacterized protein n=1 Tax=Catagonus wagneri TaxID=51154 RepID=A0A8C3W270_9CETA
MNFQLMYVNMFNKTYFSCQSVATCVVFCQTAIVGSTAQDRSQIWGREVGFAICCSHLSPHYLCLNLKPKGYFASHTSFHFVSLSEHMMTSEKWHY